MSEVLKKAIAEVGPKFEDLSIYFGRLEMEKVITLNEFEETLPISVNGGYWQINNPISIEESKLIERMNLKTNEKNRYATVIFRNVSSCEVKAIRGIVTYLNAFDEEIESKMFELIDIHAKPGELFGHRYHAKITNANVRNLKLTMIKIMFKNNQKWQVSDENSTILLNHEIFTEDIQFEEELILLKYSLAWNQVAGKTELKNNLKITNQYWICPCGTLNHKSNDDCCYCHSNLAKIQESMTEENIEKVYLVHNESIKKLNEFLETTNKIQENERIRKMINISKPIKKSWLSKKSATS